MTVSEMAFARFLGKGNRVGARDFRRARERGTGAHVRGADRDERDRGGRARGVDRERGVWGGFCRFKLWMSDSRDVEAGLGAALLKSGEIGAVGGGHRERDRRAVDGED